MPSKRKVSPEGANPFTIQKCFFCDQHLFGSARPNSALVVINTAFVVTVCSVIDSECYKFEADVPNHVVDGLEKTFQRAGPNTIP